MPRNEALEKSGSGGPQSGFTYLYVMFVVAVMGITLALAGEFWHTARQREKERELLFAGHEFRRAIEAYQLRNPGKALRELPDLILDPNQPVTQRYLRRIYVDPMTNRMDWALIRDAQGSIVGIHSRSASKPIKVDNFSEADGAFAAASSYADWLFIARPPAPITALR